LLGTSVCCSFSTEVSISILCPLAPPGHSDTLLSRLIASRKCARSGRPRCGPFLEPNRRLCLIPGFEMRSEKGSNNGKGITGSADSGFPRRYHPFRLTYRVQPPLSGSETLCTLNLYWQLSCAARYYTAGNCSDTSVTLPYPTRFVKSFSSAAKTCSLPPI
jgi:hypothetical protein